MITTPRRRALPFAAALLAAMTLTSCAFGATTSPSCGTTIRKADGSVWQCTFDDEFNGSLDGSKWVAQQTALSGFTNGQTSCFVDNPKNIFVSSGSLKLVARKESAPFLCKDPYGDFTTQYTTGMVSTYGRFGQAYGRFEVRAKVPPTAIKGLQESLWLWPVDPAKYGSWPASGEIDIAEMYSAYNDRAIPYVHYNAASPDPSATSNTCMISSIGSYHTYAVEWTPLSIKMIYDGKTCIEDYWNPASPLVKPQPFDQPFIVALTQALGIGANAFDPSSTPLPATTTIDYVHVWK